LRLVGWFVQWFWLEWFHRNLIRKPQDAAEEQGVGQSLPGLLGGFIRIHLPRLPD
jgi:hypothetical protein